MTEFFTVVQIVCSIIVIIAILLQPSKGGGATPFSASSQGLFGQSGGTHFLFKLTMVCMGIILFSSIGMARWNLSKSKESVIDVTAPQTTEATPPTTAPATPAVPTTTEAPKPAETTPTQK